jgi:hypothetical protein
MGTQEILCRLQSREDRRQAVFILSHALLEVLLRETDITLSSGEKLPKDIRVLDTHHGSEEFGNTTLRVLLESPEFDALPEGIPLPRIA